jgi:hypothetical protein
MIFKNGTACARNKLKDYWDSVPINGKRWKLRNKSPFSKGRERGILK